MRIPSALFKYIGNVNYESEVGSHCAGIHNRFMVKIVYFECRYLGIFMPGKYNAFA